MSKKKARPMKSPQNPPPDLDLPQSAVKQSVGITEAVHQFLEVFNLPNTHTPPIICDFLLIALVVDGRDYGPNEPLVRVLPHPSWTCALHGSGSICHSHQRFRTKRHQWATHGAGWTKNTVVGPVPHKRKSGTGPSDAPRFSPHGQPGPGANTSAGNATPSKPARHQLKRTECQHVAFSKQQEEEAIGR